MPQILILGLEGAGKTAFLYADIWEYFEPTLGFNYEEIQLRGIVKVGVWDVSGRQSLKCLWPSFYRNILFSGIVFIVDADKDDKFGEVRKEINILVN